MFDSCSFRWIRPASALALAAASVASLAAVDAATQAIVDWNELMVKTTSTGTVVLDESRSAAIVQIAVFDAVNAISPRYRPYFFDKKGDSKASSAAAAVTAYRDTLTVLYPKQKATLDAAYADSLKRIPDGTAKDAGILIGHASAAVALIARVDDHSTDPVEFVPKTGPGMWQPTPGDGIFVNLDPRGPDNAPPFGPGWGKVTPFVMESGSQFRPGPPPDLKSDTYTKDYAEMVAIGGSKSSTRSEEQTKTALMWWATGIPLWNQPARQLAIARNMDPLTAAHAFALLNATMADATIAGWDAKWHYQQWRPITGIRNADVSINPATKPIPDWSPLMWTPTMPDYPSGHASNAGAVAVVLKHLFGDKPGHFSMTGTGGITRQYDSFDEVVQQCIDARVWGGAHWRSSDTLGVEMGRRLGEFIVSKRAK